MSRITKWKLEKTKVKVVFRLQFHATHVPQPGWDKLFISFIPADIGKPTAKTAKANVRNGICKWSDPIYETTKLLQDARTKVYDEKLYKFVVSMGSTRSSLLGEAIINLAEYADASKPSSVALSLNGCDFGTVLHVTVQLLTSKTGFREFEQQRELRERGYQMNKGHSTHEELLNLRENTATPANDQMDKVNARVRFKPESSELRSLGEVGELNEDYDLSVAIDGSSNTSESLNTDKNDISSTHEIDSIKSTVSGDIGGYSLGQSNQSEKEDQTNNRLLRQGSSDWIHGWSSDYSVDHDLASAYEENNKLRRSLEAAESSILELKLEVSSVQSLADELGVETQRLAEQLTEEISSTEQLAKEVSILKSECSNVKDDFELLRHAKESHHYNGTGTGMSSLGVSKTTLQCSRVETSKNSIPLPLDVQVSVAMRNRDLPDSPVDTKNYVVHDFYKRWMQDLVLLEHKVREIRSHTSLGCHDRDRGQLHSDLEILESVLQNLKQNTPRLTSSLHMEGTNYKEAPATDVQIPEYCYRNEGIEWQSVGHHCSENTSPGLSSHHWLSRGIHPIEDNIDAAFEMKGKLHELSHELKESITERESLTKKMNQMERYYETLIQELEESQRQTLSELQKLQKEHTTCLDTILAFQEQIAKMHQDMNEQFLQFSEDRRGLDSHNKELERRATISETALKRVHLNYSITVDKLQKDLELLSTQVLSMFETNENLARQTFAEVSQLYFEEYLREHPEEASTCMPKDGLKSSVRQGQCKPAFQGFLPEVIPSKRIEQDPFPLFSGVHMEIKNKSLSVTQKLDEFPESFRILKSKLGSQESDIVGTLQCHKTISEEKNQLTKDDINLEEMKKSLRLHEQLCQEAETELSEMYAFIVHMDVFSKVLQEKLYDLNDGARHMKQELGDVAQQLEHSTQSNEILMLQLHTALDEVRILRQNDAKYVSQCNDLMSTNYMLEGKLQEFLNENHLLSEKVMESERLITDYETKYESCTAEKKVLENLLKNESLEKSSLQREIQTTIEEIKALKMAFDKQSLEKDTLQKSSTLIQSKLMDLYCNMTSYSEQINGPYSGIPLQKDLDDKDCTAIILSIEELQQEAQVKFSLVNDERERLMIESKNYECMFMSCTAEKVKLENLLKQKKLENIGLQNKISSLTEDIKALEVEFSKQVSIKDDLQRTFAHLQDKLGELCSSIVSCIEQVNQPSSTDMSLQKELENKNFMAIISHLEVLHQGACAKIVQLSQEKEEFERSAMECSSYRSKYETCTAEYAVLENLLKQEGLEKNVLQGEIRSITEDFKTLKDEFNKQSSEKDILQHAVTSLQDKFGKLYSTMITYDEHVREPTFASVSQEPESKNTDLLNIILHLEEYQQGIFNKIIHLSKEKEDIEKQRDTAQASLSCIESQTLSLKQKFESDVQELMGKLDLSNAYVEKLQLELQEVSHKLQISMENEKKCSERNRELSSKLMIFEIELEQITSEKGEFDPKLKKYESIEGELERTKMSLLESQQENRTLMNSTQATDETVLQLQNELHCVKESLRCMDDELQMEKGITEKLGIKVMDLSSQLNEKQEQLLSLDELKTEMSNFVQCVSDLEVEKSRLQHLLSQKEKSQEKADDSMLLLQYQVADQETQLTILQEYFLAADVELVFTKSQFQIRMHELVDQVEAMESYNQELSLKHLEVTNMVNSHKYKEAYYLEENAKLSTALQSLRSEFEAVVYKTEDLTGFLDQRSKMLAEIEKLKLNLSNAHVEKLQLELQDVSDKLQISLEAEKKHSERNRDLSSKLMVLEIELEQVTSEKDEFAQKLEKYEIVEEELERTKMSLLQSQQENGTLMNSTQAADETVIQLQNELHCVKESLRCMHDELQLEKGLTEKLGIKVMDLSSQLNEKQEQLLSLDELKTEMSNFVRCVSDLEVEKSRLLHLLSHKEKSQEKADDSMLLLQYQFADQETQLTVLQEYFLAADVELVFTKSQFQIRMHELVDQVEAMESYNQELSLKHLEVTNMVNSHKYKEAHYLEENERLSTALQSLRSEFEAVVYKTEDLMGFLDQRSKMLAEIEKLKLNLSNAHVEKLQLELQDVSDKLQISLEAEKKHSGRNRDLSSKLMVLEIELEQVTSENDEFAQKLEKYEIVEEELERTKMSLLESQQENRTLMNSTQAADETVIQLQNELHCVKESLRCMHDELQMEKGLTEKLGIKVMDLSSQLNEKQEQLLSLDELKTEMSDFVQCVSDLEVEKSRLQHLLSQKEKSQEKADNGMLLLQYQVADQETQLTVLQEYFLAADVELVFTKSQFQVRMHELVDQVEAMESYNQELSLKHLEVANMVNSHKSREAHYLGENARLSTALQCLRSEFEAVVCETKDLMGFLGQRSTLLAEVEKFKDRIAMLEATNLQEKHRHELENTQMKGMLCGFDAEMDDLMSSIVELETTFIVLRSKLDEQQCEILLHEDCGKELKQLRAQNNDLTCRLSEQVLKAEEFRLMCLHLKELKDKAVAECCQAHERREQSDGLSVITMQESLRIAFIREQCETQVQELRNQLYVSKKHGEELLLKFQNSLDEIESLKKSEAFHLKRNEEFSEEIMELETELQKVLAEKRELIKANDRMKAELECSLISLDCCKEEKLKLEYSMQECVEEMNKTRAELNLMKGKLKNFMSITNIQERRGYAPNSIDSTSIEQQAEDCDRKTWSFPLPERTGIWSSGGDVEGASRASIDKSMHPEKDDILPKDTFGNISEGPVEQNLLLPESIRHHISENIKEQQSLKNSMDYLQKELEKLKSDSLALIPQEEHNFDPALQNIQKEFKRLHMANDQLVRIFPSLKESSGSGNALERMLALELELAEALQANKTSDLQSESSSPKQHNDDEAVLQRFRDINELIKDMLELKQRNAAVETELIDMHGRYSQLSLQFAEVEGERQKLVMTLKNRRAPRMT